MYCRACRRALNSRTSPSGRVTYVHAVELRGEACDHPADPAPLSEVADPVMECDFCSRPDPAWTYLCDDQQTHLRAVTARVVGARDYRDRHGAARVLRTETEPGLTQAWGNRWAACDGCAPLIEQRDLYGLVGRVADAMPAKYTRGKRLARIRGELHATYTRVFATLSPGRSRITPTQPLGVWEPPQESPASPTGANSGTDPEASNAPHEHRP
jgi:hypothetical protein